MMKLCIIKPHITHNKLLNDCTQKDSNDFITNSEEELIEEYEENNNDYEDYNEEQDKYEKEPGDD